MRWVTSPRPALCSVLAVAIERSLPDTSRTPLTMVSSAPLATWRSLVAEASSLVAGSIA
jgi:hypothetical protein